MDCVIHGVAKSWTQLSDFSFPLQDMSSHWWVHPRLILFQWLYEVQHYDYDHDTHFTDENTGAQRCPSTCPKPPEEALEKPKLNQGLWCQKQFFLQGSCMLALRERWKVKRSAQKSYSIQTSHPGPSHEKEKKAAKSSLKSKGFIRASEEAERISRCSSHKPPSLDTARHGFRNMLPMNKLVSQWEWPREILNIQTESLETHT